MGGGLTTSALSLFILWGKDTTNFPNFLILKFLSTIKKLIGNDLVTELNSSLCLISIVF